MKKFNTIWQNIIKRKKRKCSWINCDKTEKKGIKWNKIKYNVIKLQ